MISWIVASHDDKILHANLLASLFPRVGEEILIERDASSIAQAYNRGQARATQPIRCYLHHDVVLKNPDRLRDLLDSACTRTRGLVGVCGSLVPAWPWWEAPMRVGSCGDARLGLLHFSPGGETAAIVDGVLLATRQPLVWDEQYTGFHGYDHDQSVTQLVAGRPNYVLAGGADLVFHNRVSSTSPTDTSRIPGWAQAEQRFRSKWAPAIF